MKNSLVWIVVILLLFFSTPYTKASDPTEEDRTVSTVQTLQQATVKVQADVLTSGTGFFISPDTVLTNEHVIHTASSSFAYIKFEDGHTCGATIGYREENIDLAILHVQCQNDNVLKLTESFRVGQTVVSLGNPSQFDFTASKGIISAERWGYIQFDAKANHGASGSPVADLNGNVVGITTAGAKDSQYMTFAVKSKDINAFLRRSQPNG